MGAYFMSILEAIILGFIQGATEFLPISSSGHLVLLPEIFGLGSADLTMIGVVHLGSLVAVFIYFWKDIWAIITAVLQGISQRDLMGITESRLGWLIVIGSIPAVVLGLLFEGFFESIFGSPTTAAFFLLITAGLLVLGEKMLSGKKDIPKMKWFDAFVIGVFQSFALFPGISRSGSTIVGGLQRGLDRPTATRFSFLLGIPVILGAGLLSIVDIVLQPEATQDPIIYIAAFLSAAITGYVCIYFLLRWVRNHSLYIFSVYCALLGGGYLLYTFLS